MLIQAHSDTFKFMQANCNGFTQIQNHLTLFQKELALAREAEASATKEVAALRNELHAVAQVTDAVGQAVGQLYQTFLGQSEVTDQSGYYPPSEQGPELPDDY